MNAVLDIPSRPVRGPEGNTPYARAVTGFTEYWYPFARSNDITEKPTAFKLLGQPVAVLRRDGKAYALRDACPHRGTPLSAGIDEFPGTGTIVCRYHGWTFDVRSGGCVGNLCEGPDSKVVGRARVRTYPIEERKGIVWIWMGGTPPVPLEEDVPKLLLQPSAVVRVRSRKLYGNWRWHAENVAGGHAQLVHKDSLWHWFHARVAFPSKIDPHPHEDADGAGIVTGYSYLTSEKSAEYPGLGRWPRQSALRDLVLKVFGSKQYGSVEGISESLLRLPGCYRVVHHPMKGAIYYEWWTPVDEDHYIYFQVTTYHPKTAWSKFLFDLRYYLWGLPVGAVLFNNQDAHMVKYTTDHVKRVGWVYHSKLTRQDEFHALWRKMCNEQARDATSKNQGASNDG